MNTDVIIKANSHGIRIILSDDCSLEQILKDIKDKLYKQESFLKKGGKVHVSFEGRPLSHTETDQLLYELNHLPDTEVEFCYEAESRDLCSQIDIPPHKAKEHASSDKETFRVQTIRNKAEAGKSAAQYNYELTPPAARQKKAAKAIAVEKEEATLFFHGNLSRGQTLEVKKSIIILGNVEKKAKIISSGNIIIIGALNGEAIAGRDMLEKRFVLALHMEPVHIKIGNAVFTGNRQDRKHFNTNDAVIAYCENGQLVFQTLSQTSL